MCGRYVSLDEAFIEREFNLVHQEWQFPSSFNVARNSRCGGRLAAPTYYRRCGCTFSMTSSALLFGDGMPISAVA